MKIWHWIVLAVLTAASIIAEFVGSGSHGEAVKHSWSGIPLFWILFGAAGCAALIAFAKFVLAPVIYKKEDYYNE